MKTPKTAQTQTNTFLSHEEICDLTGFRTAKKQCEHLRQMGIPFFPNARGYPRVMRSTLTGDKNPPPQKPTKMWQPNV